MKNRTGTGAYFFLIMLLVAAAIWLGLYSRQANIHTKAEFDSAMAKGEVVSVTIVQNREVPTGNIRVLLKDGTGFEFSVTDVTEIEDYTLKNGIETFIRDVPKDNWFLEYVLPYLLIIIIFVFFFHTFS